jgi:hypothetical protein
MKHGGFNRELPNPGQTLSPAGNILAAKPSASLLHSETPPPLHYIADVAFR